jgi:hypothetical protein
MATGMRKWVLGVGVSSTVLAAWLIPPEPWDVWLPTRREVTPERREAQRLGSEIFDLRNKLKRVRAAEYIAQKIASSRDRDSGLVLGFPDELSDEARETIRQSVLEELERWSSPAPSIVVGVLALPQSFGDSQGWDLPFNPFGEFFIDTEAEVPYCARLLTYRSTDRLNEPQAVMNLTEDSSDPGLCRYYARFGAPGPVIATWLRDQGFFVYAQSVREVPETWWADYRPDRDPFGMTAWRRRGGRTADGEGCYAAKDDACRRSLGLDQTTSVGALWARYEEYREIPSWAFASFSYRGVAFGRLNRSILYTLRMEFGDEAFEAFWTSEENVEEAFEAAFGLSFVDWTKRWILRGEEPLEAGPGLAMRDTLLALLTLAAMVAVVGAVTRARKVV